MKNAPPSSNWDSEVRLLAWLATCVSVMSFLFYFQRGDVLLYGDAVGHINIARRVFDSKTPGLLQLGTVWLPLPHLLMIPFLISNEMWRLGVGGSIPSMVAYVFGVVGMFRLVRGALSRGLEPHGAARVAAWTAAFVYASNPNLIYMQTTAMGEALYLSLFIWVVVYFSEFVRGNAKALTKCGLCLAGACLTRYDGWFLAAAVVAVVLFYLLAGNVRTAFRVNRTQLRKFILITAAAPLLWLAYNGIVYRNPLEFANGPYSAKAIERRTQSARSPGHPGSGNLLLAGMYFLKSAEANLAQYEGLQRAWILLAVAGIAVTGLQYRKSESNPAAPPPSSACVLLLLVPIPFYALSVAYGGIPIFVPAWWPFSHYNVRYGLQLLPAFAASLAILTHLAMRSGTWKPRVRLACVLGLLAFVIASYASIWHTVPVSLNEAQINMRTRNQLEAQVAVWLQKDPDGLWERALGDPARFADYVVAFDGDSVWQAVQSHHFAELVEIHVTGQARAVLYRTR